jgi:hypothetical protein
MLPRLVLGERGPEGGDGVALYRLPSAGDEQKTLWSVSPHTCSTEVSGAVRPNYARNSVGARGKGRGIGELPDAEAHPGLQMRAKEWILIVSLPVR